MKQHERIQDKIRERVLIARLNSKDSEVFVEVYNFYIDRIYRYIYFKASSREDAEDLTSDVFLKAWQHVFLHNKKVTYLNAFLFQIARSQVIDYYRSRARQQVVGSLEGLEAIKDPHQENLLGKIDITIDILKIEGLLKKLKDEYREIVLLKYVEDLSTSEISKIINKSQGAVRILLHRAMKELKTHLNPHIDSHE